MTTWVPAHTGFRLLEFPGIVRTEHVSGVFAEIVSPRISL